MSWRNVSQKMKQICTVGQIIRKSAAKLNNRQTSGELLSNNRRAVGFVSS